MKPVPLLGLLGAAQIPKVSRSLFFFWFFFGLPYLASLLALSYFFNFFFMILILIVEVFLFYLILIEAGEDCVVHLEGGGAVARQHPSH